MYIYFFIEKKEKEGKNTKREEGRERERERDSMPRLIEEYPGDFVKSSREIQTF